MRLPNGSVLTFADLEPTALFALLGSAPSLQGSAEVPTFGWYTVNRFLPIRRAGWRKKTRDVYELVFRHHILLRWEKIPLDKMDGVDVQSWLTEMAISGYSRSLIGKCLMYTRAVLEDAVDEGLIRRNPTRKLRIPADAKPEQTEASSAEDIALLLLELPRLKDKLILKMLVLCGFRPHELFALRWDDLGEESIRIDETLEKTVPVPIGKTSRSLGCVGIPQMLVEELKEWRTQTSFSADRDFIFASEARTPGRMDAWRKRYLQPAAKRAKIGKIDLRQMRRTFGTLAKQAGMDIKDIADQLRHSTIRTTAKHYVKKIDETILRGLNTLDTVLRDQEVAVREKVLETRRDGLLLESARGFTRDSGISPGSGESLERSIVHTAPSQPPSSPDQRTLGIPLSLNSSSEDITGRRNAD